MKPYLVAAWIKPTKRQSEDGGVPKIVLQPTLVLATDEQQATLQASRLIKEDVDISRVEVAVLPFCA